MTRNTNRLRGYHSYYSISNPLLGVRGTGNRLFSLGEASSPSLTRELAYGLFDYSKFEEE
jgi:hypothetical protein